MRPWSIDIVEVEVQVAEDDERNRRHIVKTHILKLAAILAFLALPAMAGAQGIGRGATEGADVGNRAAGPVGAVVGGTVGGVAGGVAGGVKGVLGVPQRSTYYGHRYSHRGYGYRHHRRGGYYGYHHRRHRY